MNGLPREQISNNQETKITLTSKDVQFYYTIVIYILYNIRLSQSRFTYKSYQVYQVHGLYFIGPSIYYIDIMLPLIWL